MERLTLKHTKSLSPITCKEVDAKVVLEDGKVILEKKDEQGKEYKSLIEKDYDYYQRMAKERIPMQVSPNALFLYISAKCNLNCAVCYEYGNTYEEPSKRDIERLLERFKGKVVVLMGREPTCREDLFEIIKIAAKKNRVCLLTNGLKLVDYDYVRRLKEAGLDSVTLSFNSFDDDVYIKMNGRPLLDQKLKALENIKRVGIKTVLSATLARETNEEEIKKLCDYVYDNRSFIYEFRIRAATIIGRHLDIEPFCMTELMEMVAKSLGLEKDDILKEQTFWAEFLKEIKYFVPEQVRTFVRTRLCSFSFHVTREGGKYSCLGSHVDMDALKKTKFKKTRLIYNLIKGYSLRYILQNLCFVLKIPFKFDEANSIMVVLRCWPNVYNIDLEENRKCPSQYYKDGGFVPFCYSNILLENKTTKESTNV